MVALGALIYAIGLNLRNQVFDEARYMRFRREVGFGLFLTGLCLAMSMVGLARVDRLDDVFVLPDSNTERVSWQTVRESIVTSQGTLLSKDGYDEVVTGLDELMGKVGALNLKLMRRLERNEVGPVLQSIDELRRDASDIAIKYRIAARAHGNDSPITRHELLVLEESLTLFHAWTQGLRIPRAYDQPVRLLYTVLFALFGTLFYLYRALEEKEKSTDAFDRDKFWGGLWFRAGQSLLYTLLLFLVMRSEFSSGIDPSGQGPGLSEALLPLYALLIGMYVRVAEGVFEALGRRMLAVFGISKGAGGSRVEPGIPEKLEQIKKHHGGWVGDSKLRLSELSFDVSKGQLSATLSKEESTEPLPEADLIQMLTAHVATVPALDLRVASIEVANREELGDVLKAQEPH